MLAITRSDTARGFGRASRALRSLQPIERLSFLGVPHEIRVCVFELLFASAYMRIGDRFKPYMEISQGCFDPMGFAILSVCRQARQKAWPVLLTCLTLRLWCADDSIVTQIPARVEISVLPYVQRVALQEYHKVTTPDTPDTRVMTFLRKAPLLRTLNLGTCHFNTSGPIKTVYQAIANAEASWRSSSGITGFGYYNGWLIHNTLRGHGLENGYTRSTLGSQMNNIGSEAGAGSSGSGITCTAEGCVSCHQRGYAVILVTFDLQTLQVLDRSVSVRRLERMKTIRDARVWAFGEQGCILQGETAEQAELEGRKLLADLKDT